MAKTTVTEIEPSIDQTVQPLMYSDESLGQALGVSKWTIERARKAGELPAYKIGSLVRITREDAMTWAQARPWEPKKASA
ncbi:excisionase family DNA-binding protein [Rhodococcus hoagii]|nr:excisionase family DNA-binding protein [Prescottella equi]NKR94264.1 excisionase family DNA-binding protein [Prescottella equi]NKS69391.1 excisionase family DNA-binding protein [Prescottella equi]